MSTHNKLVAFFDVLGYKSFIQNNDLNKVIEKMDDLISGLRFSTHVCIYEDNNESVQLAEHIIFSDSIIFYTDDLSSVGFSRLVHVSKIFIYAALTIGLPVRGSISFGEFYVQGNLFFGSALVEAYENGEDQNWSGGFINDSCINYVGKSYPEALSFLMEKGYLVKYDIPCKSELRSGKYAINWANEDVAKSLLSSSHIYAMFLRNTSKKLIDDLNNCHDIKRSFKIDEYIEGKTDKEIQSIEDKIMNTIKFCQFGREKGGGIMKVVYTNKA